MQKHNLIGCRFDRLLVLDESVERKIANATNWICQCDCGKKTIATTAQLNSGKKKSCGCGKIIDLTGHKIGKLTALEKTAFRLKGRIAWRCSCDCGNSVLVSSADLVSGNKRSCGCLKPGRKPAKQEGYKGVKQEGLHWVAFHPMVGDISSHGTEYDAACAVRDWLSDKPDLQQFWPLSGYPA